MNAIASSALRAVLDSTSLRGEQFLVLVHDRAFEARIGQQLREFAGLSALP